MDSGQGNMDSGQGNTDSGQGNTDSGQGNIYCFSANKDIFQSKGNKEWCFCKVVYSRTDPLIKEKDKENLRGYYTKCEFRVHLEGNSCTNKKIGDERGLVLASLGYRVEKETILEYIPKKKGQTLWVLTTKDFLEECVQEALRRSKEKESVSMFHDKNFHFPSRVPLEELELPNNFKYNEETNMVISKLKKPPGKQPKIDQFLTPLQESN